MPSSRRPGEAASAEPSLCRAFRARVLRRQVLPACHARHRASRFRQSLRRRTVHALRVHRRARLAIYQLGNFRHGAPEALAAISCCAAPAAASPSAISALLAPSIAPSSFSMKSRRLRPGGMGAREFDHDLAGLLDESHRPRPEQPGFQRDGHAIDAKLPYRARRRRACSRAAHAPSCACPRGRSPHCGLARTASSPAPPSGAAHARHLRG